MVCANIITKLTDCAGRIFFKKTKNEQTQGLYTVQLTLFIYRKTYGIINLKKYHSHNNCRLFYV